MNRTNPPDTWCARANCGRSPLGRCLGWQWRSLGRRCGNRRRRDGLYRSRRCDGQGWCFCRGGWCDGDGCRLHRTGRCDGDGSCLHRRGWCGGDGCRLHRSGRCDGDGCGLGGGWGQCFARRLGGLSTCRHTHSHQGNRGKAQYPLHFVTHGAFTPEIKCKQLNDTWPKAGYSSLSIQIAQIISPDSLQYQQKRLSVGNS